MTVTVVEDRMAAGKEFDEISWSKHVALMQTMMQAAAMDRETMEASFETSEQPASPCGYYPKQFQPDACTSKRLSRRRTTESRSTLPEQQGSVAICNTVEITGEDETNHACRLRISPAVRRVSAYTARSGYTRLKGDVPLACESLVAPFGALAECASVIEINIKGDSPISLESSEQHAPPQVCRPSVAKCGAFVRPWMRNTPTKVEPEHEVNNVSTSDDSFSSSSSDQHEAKLLVVPSACSPSINSTLSVLNVQKPSGAKDPRGSRPVRRALLAH